MTEGTVQARRGLRQFGRSVRVVVGPPGGKGRTWTAPLRINFNVKKTGGKKPDEGKVQIYNLSPDSRGFVDQDGLVVFVYAGYGAAPELVFQGAIDDTTHKQDGLDWVTEIEARDGGAEFREGAVFETFKPPLDSTTLLNRVAQAMGLRFAVIPPDLPVLNFSQGYTLATTGRDALDEITTSLGAQWLVQDGELVVVVAGKATPEVAVLLTPQSGLVGRPEVTKEGVELKALLNGRIKPKRPLRLESRTITGWFMAEEVTHQGDSGWQQDFYTVIKATEVAP